jgi:hypothetical protein
MEHPAVTAARHFHDSRRRASEARATRIALRDQFAMAALTGLLSKHGNDGPTAAAIAYSFADDMLKARKDKNDDSA